MFTTPEESQAMWILTLPERNCTACTRRIPRRKHRVTLRASWRGQEDILCPKCWMSICQWAQRFALIQGILPAMEAELQKT